MVLTGRKPSHSTCKPSSWIRIRQTSENYCGNFVFAFSHFDILRSMIGSTYETDSSPGYLTDVIAFVQQEFETLNRVLTIPRVRITTDR
jgi:hypothetical protein